MTTGTTVPVSPAVAGRATQQKKHFLERWFFPGMAVLMIATSVAGFAPAILDTTGRRGPVSALLAIHGIVFLVCLLLFLVQTLLIRSALLVSHRRLGIASFFVLIILVPVGYQAAIAMIQRGYDLSGDQFVGFSAHGPSLHAQTASVFNLIDLAWFTLLAVGALWFRARPAIHKRLMLFANIQLMGASLTHLLGHTGLLTVGTVIGSFSLFLCCFELKTLADGVGLSSRHFARRFIEQAGVSRKLFAKIVRFQAALETKALCAAKSWTEIAHHFGYYDQVHMIHDFEQLAGGSPKQMLAHLETVFVEPIRHIRLSSIAPAAASNSRLTL